MVATVPSSAAAKRDPIADFASCLRGELILPESASYDEVRALWNAEFDRRPTLIARVADEYDVVACVRFARKHGLPIAVRGGGHSFAGFSMIEGGLVVDLSRMKALKIDPERRVSRAQPGLTWGEYAKQAEVYGLATTSGDAPSVGVAGLTLGGGIGWFVRKHGMAIDHLLAVELVTADGRRVRASEQENPDLFWALRGGGGNFGIVTALEFKLHDAGTVAGGAVIFSGDELESVLRNWRDFMATAPDELTTIVDITNVPPVDFFPEELHGKIIVYVSACYAGDVEEGMRVIAPLRDLGTPLLDMLGPIPYTALFDMAEDAAAPGNHHFVRSGFFDTLPDSLIDTVAQHSRAKSSPDSLIQLRMLGGQMARVSPDATAFAHRQANYMFLCAGIWTPANNDDAPIHKTWVERFWGDVGPQTNGVYVNFLRDEGEARKRSAYNEQKLARLAEVKAKYDPDNAFRANQNIAPAKR